MTIEVALALAAAAGPGLIALGILWAQNRQNASDIRDARKLMHEDYDALLKRIHASNDKIQQLLLDVSYLMRIRDGAE